VSSSLSILSSQSANCIGPGYRRDLQFLGDNLAGDGPDIVEIGIPELDQRLVLKPSLADQEAKDLRTSQRRRRKRQESAATYHARPVLGAAGLPGGLDDLCGDDGAVGLGDLVLGELAWHSGLNEVPQLESNARDIGGRNSRLELLVLMRRKDWSAMIKSMVSG
jgi:hypothetical protein